MTLAKILAVLALVSIATGCNSPQSHRQPQAMHYQRFVPIPPDTIPAEGVPWHGYFALDTKTGTLCRTIIYHDFPKGAWANDIPACSQVLTANPD
jgi:hypothetical protein